MATEEDKKINPKENEEAPQTAGRNEPVAFDPSPLLARIEKLEDGVKLLKEGINFVRGTNWFILVVLFVGFLALLISLIGGIMQANNSNTATQVEFIKSVQQLTNTVDKLDSSLKQIKPAAPPNAQQ
ncbi:MAG: hypothetical protein A3H50_01295 [Candidatus Levybacteria bacterium RIFCSPLOWO2_02_FULL_37_10]|nr:MAG: hypothetical protein A2860_00020 [Candidatus Levybacteria bacterium RIFCSPHIGHO2_01_FULL_37_33]OGH16887.1 MAG: hypothetical protein A3C97_00525 [Candidatus Levybacteria bacterium RIFCSPHIGHO2_02_FULL_37_11]OGH29208.1 MAG: hypothetical protein A3F30_04400 [Candidatus Levybacteria bacterium RIFCSPHIGHO2_12_FULL_37_12]OGH44028.1 MAG: hypothetical protein A3H50_01295 [Candidatus Levybacteria bacterium RIFCSPLOWO2_02_FULL_37_10]